MSATLVAKGLTAKHGDRVLFSGLDLVIAPHDVIGLVGVNGAGKSTLLSMLSGAVVPGEGSVGLLPPSATVGHLAQQPVAVRDETVREFLHRRTGVAAARHDLDHALAEVSRGETGADDHYAASLDSWLNLGGADIDVRAETVSTELGLFDALERSVQDLSGGQAARVGLAAMLLSQYDLYLLDEPTNDLDLDGLARLEEFVAGLTAPMVVVSHDREFLARTVNRVVEIDLAQQQANSYSGGYETYLEERAVLRRHAREKYEEYADTRARLEARAHAQRAWMAKGVRNARRKANDPDKAGRRFRTETSEKQASKVRQTERALERLEVVNEPRKEWELRFEIASAPRAGAMVAALRRAVVHRGEFVLGPVDLQIGWQDRVVITGANGAGKSTLLAALLGRIELDSGQVAVGNGVMLGEIDQVRDAFAGPTPLLDIFGTQLPAWKPAEVRTLLAKFGLGAEHIGRAVDTLSPGERTRAGLALLQARGVNLLVLDEPTNHLDLAAIEQLESALDVFPGTLLLVTHDRRMRESVHITRRIEMIAGRVADGLV